MDRYSQRTGNTYIRTYSVAKKDYRERTAPKKMNSHYDLGYDGTFQRFWINAALEPLKDIIHTFII